MSDDSKRVPSGKLRRLVRVATLGPRATVAMARDAIGRATGEEAGDHLGDVLYETLGKLKGGSLKAGQLFTQVADALPDAAQARLARLFSSAPTLQWSAVAEVIEAELGRPAEQVFAEIETEPFAAASLGQVHRGRLPDGTEVAVKVQYPGVAEALTHDLELLHGVVGTVSGGGLLLDIQGYFQALRDDTLAELDYRREVQWLSRMAQVVRPWPDLVVPQPFDEFSTERVLTCTLLHGIPLTDAFDSLPDDNARRTIAQNLVRAVFGPLFHAHILNADAHPGNFLLLDDNRLGLVDFGAAAEWSADRVRGLANLLRALIDPSSADPIDQLHRAGIRMRRPDRKVLGHMVELMSTPFRGPVDFATDSTLKRLTKFKQQHPIAMLRFEADPEMLPLFRALVGVNHSLKRLGVKLDVGSLLLELDSTA